MADEQPKRPLTDRELDAARHLFDTIWAAETGDADPDPRTKGLSLWAKCVDAVTRQVPAQKRSSPFGDLDDDVPF